MFRLLCVAGVYFFSSSMRVIEFWMLLHENGIQSFCFKNCRPMNADEEKLHTPMVITCSENKREVCAVQNIANKQIDRSFLFDKVFGPKSQQKDLYHSAVSPIVFEVLEGYNCTIFAYGQTGTGKTYTMEGGGRKKVYTFRH